MIKKIDMVSKYKQALFEMVRESCDNEMVVRYTDAISVFDQLLDEMMFNECRRYDFWDTEI